VTVVVSDRPADAAGNPNRPRTWTFTTAPGTAYDPQRGMVVKAGTHTGYLIGTDGRLSAPRTVDFAGSASAAVGQRAEMPNLPGRWLHVEDGRLAGRWLRESRRRHLPGEVERVTYDTSTRMVLRKGRHTGFRFDADGNVTDRHRSELGGKATVRVSGRRIVNGTAYLRVVSGRWAGYLIRESRRAYLPGLIERTGFPDRATVSLRAGTHTGFRYASDGRVLERRTSTIGGGREATARAWAVINGVGHFRITDGRWGGTWVPESADVRVDA
jgi:hypothetical protein